MVRKVNDEPRTEQTVLEELLLMQTAVALERALERSQVANVKECQRRLDLTKEAQDLALAKQMFVDIQIHTHETEDRLRALAVEYYNLTKEKRVVDHVSVRLVNKFKITDEARVVAWCLRHDFINLLKPKEAEIKKLSIGVGGSGLVIDGTQVDRDAVEALISSALGEELP